MRRCSKSPARHGVAAVLSVLFLAIISTLAVAMISLTRTNSRIAMNQDNVERARANAETGMRWIAWKFASVSMPQTPKGQIDDPTAAALWPTVVKNVMADLSSMDSTVVTKKDTPTDSNGRPQIHVVASVPTPYRMDFEILATSGPSAPPWAPGATSYANQSQVIAVQSKGTCNGVTRIIKAYFLMQKTFRYGVLAKIPIQLGKNTVVEGDVYYAASPKDTQPPVLSISDFRYTSATTSDALTTKIQAYQDFLKGSSLYAGLDNRVPVSNPALVSALRASSSALANATDYNGDGYIDEYDIFLQHFDANRDFRVRQSEFLNVAPNDPNLFYLIDRYIGEPVAGSPAAPRAGYADGYCDILDPYAKITGQVRIWETQTELAARLSSSSQKIGDVLQGTILPRDGYSAPVVYGQQDPADPVTQITPGDFSQAAFLDLAGAGGGSPSTPVRNNNNGKNIPDPDPGSDVNKWPLSSREFTNTTVNAAAIANGTADPNVVADMTANHDVLGVPTSVTVTKRDANGNIMLGVNGLPLTTTLNNVYMSTTENVPYGSQGTGATRSKVIRPIVSGTVFRNCIISRGTNALFVNCTFDGVTFVDGAYNLTQPGGNALDTNNTKAAYASGNNLRFMNCTFTGPLVQGDATAPSPNHGVTPTDYTDYLNSWEFNGTTTIDLRQPANGGIGSKDGVPDSNALTALKQQATIQAPQTNIEMGSYTSPGSATCSFQGIVVAGCFDCRGVADIDGAIIVPSTAAGNATLGYFGSNDNASNQGQPDPRMINGGNGAYGRIHIRYNPLRRLPDGINLAISIYPDLKSMEEVTQWQQN